MGPWGAKMGVPPKKAPILRKMPFRVLGPRRWPFSPHDGGRRLRRQPPNLAAYCVFIRGVGDGGAPFCASPFRGMPITVFIGVPTAIKVFSWSTPIDGY